MIKERAKVVEQTGEYAWVEGLTGGQCSGCSVGGCGTSTLSRYFSRRQRRLRVYNPINAPVGSEVEMGIEEGALIKGSLIVYILPLLCAMLFAICAELINPPGDGALALLAALGLVCGFAMAQVLGNRLANGRKFQAVVLRQL